MTISSYSVQNARPREVYRVTSQIAQERLDEIARRSGRTDEGKLPQRTRIRAAEEVLNSIDFYV
ncbi:hypothetical protein J4442_03085 [Candidatus Woesearchaeota archaeon]|nr:hypothetical protein [Candidatus Woesearchaeota archaeon]